MFHGSLYVSINVKSSFISVHHLHVVPAVENVKNGQLKKKLTGNKPR